MVATTKVPDFVDQFARPAMTTDAGRYKMMMMREKETQRLKQKEIEAKVPDFAPQLPRPRDCKTSDRETDAWAVHLLDETQ